MLSVSTKNFGIFDSYQSSINTFEPTTFDQSIEQSSTSSNESESFQILKLDIALSELVELLDDDDEIVVLSALKVVHQIFRKSDHKERALNSNALIKTLFGLAMRSSNDHVVVRHIAAIISCLSHTRNGISVMLDNQALDVIYKLMQSEIEPLTHYAITALHNMLLKLNIANMAVRKTNGIHLIIQLMTRSNNTKLLAVIADCLRSLAYGSQDGKESILNYGGTNELIRIFHSYDYEKLLWNIARCVKVLSVCPKNKQRIVEIGGIQTLSYRLNDLSKRLVMNCLWTIRNLSDIASSQQDLNYLIKSLEHLLQNTNENIVACAACILANLTCNNPFNKEIVYQINALPTLLQTVARVNENKSIIEPALMTIRHVTTKHKNASNCRDLVRLQGGIQVITKFLYTPNKWSLIKIAIELIRNLAISPTNHPVLRELNIIERLIRLLDISNQEVKREMTKFEDMGDIMFQDVKVQQIIENILYTFQILETDELNCKILISLDFISICYDLINYQNENIIKLVVNCLSFLIHIPSGLKKLACEDSKNVFKKLLVSCDKDISENSQLITLSINEYRSGITNFS